MLRRRYFSFICEWKFEVLFLRKSIGLCRLLCDILLCVMFLLNDHVCTHSPQIDMKTANMIAPGLSKVAADVHLYRPHVSSTRVKPQKLASHRLVGHKIQSATCDPGSQMSWLNRMKKKK